MLRRAASRCGSALWTGITTLRRGCPAVIAARISRCMSRRQLEQMALNPLTGGADWRQRSDRLVVARDALDALVMLLRLQRHRRHRPRLEPRQRDRLAGHFAIAIFAFVEATDRAIDFGDELALPVAGAELDRPVGLARRAVGNVR